MSERDAAPADDPPGGSSAWRMSRKWIILVYQFHPLLHFPAISWFMLYGRTDARIPQQPKETLPDNPKKFSDCKIWVRHLRFLVAWREKLCCSSAEFHPSQLVISPTPP
jgi:hypothetical protein